MTNLTKAFAVSLLPFAAALATPATAAILVDTGARVDGAPRGWNEAQRVAALFTLSAASTITSIEGMIGGDSSTGNIAIFSGGVDPASSGLLFNASFAVAESRTASYQGVFGQSWTLGAGSYWVSFSTDALANFITGDATNPLSQHATSDILGNWTQQGSAYALGIRISGDRLPVVDPGAVPEPATWAMMISGFGLVGAAMRRRVTTVTYA